MGEKCDRASHGFHLVGRVDRVRSRVGVTGQPLTDIGRNPRSGKAADEVVPCAVKREGAGGASGSAAAPRNFPGNAGSLHDPLKGHREAAFAAAALASQIGHHGTFLRVSLTRLEPAKQRRVQRHDHGDTALGRLEIKEARVQIERIPVEIGRVLQPQSSERPEKNATLPVGALGGAHEGPNLLGGECLAGLGRRVLQWLHCFGGIDWNVA